MSIAIETIQVRRATAAVATANNVTLLEGEVGYETDTRKIKVGDGATAWNSLPYVIYAPLISPPLVTPSLDVFTAISGTVGSSPYAAVKIVGSMTPNISGVYSQAGTANGYNYYRSSSGYLWWYGGYWFITTYAPLGTYAGSNDFYCNSSPANPPVTSAWSAQNGASISTSMTSAWVIILDVEGYAYVSQQLNVGTTTAGAAIVVSGGTALTGTPGYNIAMLGTIIHGAWVGNGFLFTNSNGGSGTFSMVMNMDSAWFGDSSTNTLWMILAATGLSVMGSLNTRSVNLNNTATPTATAGTIYFDGTHFLGYNGSVWKQLDN